jgi:hypothetical protein
MTRRSPADFLGERFPLIAIFVISEHFGDNPPNGERFCSITIPPLLPSQPDAAAGLIHNLLISGQLSLYVTGF